MQKKIIITGVLAATLIIGGVGVAGAYNKPADVPQVAVDPIVKAKVEASNDKPEPIVDTYDVPLSMQTTQTEWDGDNHPIPNDGQYHASVHNPAGIVLHGITFHEGYRPKGLKALDVWVLARSANNGENALIGGQDEIVSATGTSGKVYNMVGSKGTGVTSNYRYKAYTEEQIVQYIDVDQSEKGIVSVVLRHGGKLITLKPDKDTQIITTHA